MVSFIDRPDIQTAARLIREAHLAVVFTGAGISTPSGIPDFRGNPSSLWNIINPMEVASLTAFRNQPDRFFDWLYPLAQKIKNAKPNAAHVAIAKLEEAGYIQAVITQNIDYLHQAAGSKKVLELHGTSRTATCTQCLKQYTSDEFLAQFIETKAIPRCSDCGGILKPDIILYEELLPVGTWAEAERFSRECDLMVIAGSSLEVVPASMLPLIAVRNGAHLIIVNQSPTDLDSLASVVLNEDVIEVFPTLTRILL
jgi:NAD-dependent deacetylase